MAQELHVAKHTHTYFSGIQMADIPDHILMF